MDPDDGEKLPLDRVKAAQSNFVQQSVEFFDVPGSFENLEAVSGSSNMALTLQPDCSLQRGSKKMYGRSPGGNAGGSSGLPSSQKDSSSGAQNKLPPSGWEKVTANSNTEISIFPSDSSSVKATLDPLPSRLPSTGAGHISQSDGDIDFAMLKGDTLKSYKIQPQQAARYSRKEGKSKRYREKSLAHDRRAALSNILRGGFKRKARWYRDKCNTVSARASGLNNRGPPTHTRYRDKMEKHKSGSPRTRERFNNMQEPLGAPEDPDQYFGMQEPDIGQDAPPPPESAIEEFAPGAVSISNRGRSTSP